MQITLSAMGGIAREKNPNMRKGQVNSIPFQWQTLMSQNGQALIREKHKEETGEEIKDIPLEFMNNDSPITIIENEEDDVSDLEEDNDSMD